MGDSREDSKYCSYGEDVVEVGDDVVSVVENNID